MASHGHANDKLMMRTQQESLMTCLKNDAFCVSSQDWKRVKRVSDFDIVIVGSGFCGYAVAEQVLKNEPRCRVLMLEQGGLLLPDHFQNLPPSFMRIVDGAYEIYPWSTSKNTARGQNDAPVWLHGVVPFLGGKSTLWSGWCPTPTEEELLGWPSATKKAILTRIEDAKRLLHVRGVDTIAGTERSPSVFGALQRAVQSALKRAHGQVGGIYRTEAAPLASGTKESQGIDFAKFALPGELLKLAIEACACEDEEQSHRLQIVTGCTVKKIILNKKGRAVSLQTSRGTLPLFNASLVLATGALPVTTLVSNSLSSRLSRVGAQFSAHFISCMTARIPIDYLNTPNATFSDLEMGAWYIAGLTNGSYKQQFHIQLSAVWSTDPEESEARASRYWADVFSMASREQLEQSKGHVVFMCAILGELDVDNADNWFRRDSAKRDRVANSTLQVKFSAKDKETWDAMDNAMFEILETILSTDRRQVTYWHGSKTNGQFTSVRPDVRERRVDALVHESSTMPIAETEDAIVDTKYKVRGANNVYVTGGALWPRGGSWNPTLAMVALSQDLAHQLVPGRVE